MPAAKCMKWPKYAMRNKHAARKVEGYAKSALPA